MVVFRVDSNSMIGKTHLYRCIAIAKAMKMMGKQVLFVCREDSDVSALQQSFLDYRLVPSQRLGSEEAIRILRDIICEVRAGVCVVDSCDIDNSGFSKLRETCKVVYLEDHFYEVYDVDCLINSNIYADKFDYLSKYPRNVEVLFGMEYASFDMGAMLGFNRRKTSEISTILVSTGDLDRYELAPGIVDTIIEAIDDNVRIKVMTSKNSSTKDKLFKMSNYSQQLIIEQDVQNFPKLLNQCDVAVFAADSVCYDLLRFKIPSCIFVNDNIQKLLQNSLVEQKLAVYGGNIIDSKNKFYYDLLKGVGNLAKEECRNELYENIEKLNIGSGADNVARAILKYE